MSVLAVPGARLHYEIHGRGPLLVMIPGASGTGEGFRRVTERLAASRSVVLYDRRGFSRSQLAAVHDSDGRLESDADDVRRLVEHIGSDPAVVFGASSGAIVGIEVLTRHPAVVRTLVSFEPPAVRLLSDGARWVDFFLGVYDLYRRSGAGPALERFREEAFPEVDRLAMAGAMERGERDQALRNTRYWFENELRQYPTVDLDLGALAAHAYRLVLAAGRLSRGYPAHRVSVELGSRLRQPVVELPGGHLGCITHPVEFATELEQVLRQGEGRRGMTALVSREAQPCPLRPHTGAVVDDARGDHAGAQAY